MKTFTALAAAMLLSSTSAFAQTVYPIDRAEILAGAKFDFKVEFGRLWSEDDMRIVLADEISPDCCRLWDAATSDKLDKDRFRRDLGGVLEAYQEVARRLGVLTENPRPKGPGPVLVSSNTTKPN